MGSCSSRAGAAMGVVASPESSVASSASRCTDARTTAATGHRRPGPWAAGRPGCLGRQHPGRGRLDRQYLGRVRPRPAAPRRRLAPWRSPPRAASPAVPQHGERLGQARRVRRLPHRMITCRAIPSSPPASSSAGLQRGQRPAAAAAAAAVRPGQRSPPQAAYTARTAHHPPGPRPRMSRRRHDGAHRLLAQQRRAQDRRRFRAHRQERAPSTAGSPGRNATSTPAEPVERPRQVGQPAQRGLVGPCASSTVISSGRGPPG